MKIHRTIRSLQRGLESHSGTLALVPTMGALHPGHLSLVHRARKAVGPGGVVVVSIYLNPTQFDRAADLEQYPRGLAADRAACRAAGVDFLFAPGDREMYAADHSTFVVEESLSRSLCGASRPGHFRGVCTIVAKLFLMVRPDLAVFGEKDFQQLAILRKLVRDLNFRVRILAVPTLREADGLAMSSRNVRLDPAARAAAPGIHAALKAARRMHQEGTTSASRLKISTRNRLRRLHGARIDYVELVQEQTLRPVRTAEKGCILATAVFFGEVRLIDHVKL